MFHLPGGTLVRTYFGDITSIKVDAVVNAGNTTLTNKQGLNRVILDNAGKSIVNEIKKRLNSSPNKKLHFGDVIVTGAGKLGCRNIIHTVHATFKNASDTNKSAVQKVVQVCLGAANEKKFRTLAFPAIGTGLSHIRHVECIDAYVNELKSWKSPHPKEIHFVIQNRALLDKIDAEFTQQFSSASTAPSSRNLRSSHKLVGKKTKSALVGNSFQSNAVTTRNLQTVNTVKAVKSGAMASGTPSTPAKIPPDPKDSTDDCSICLCDFTDRKTLDKCGHSFCSACIDHSFSVVGPYCPICLTVYGKVIGLQPPGRMTVRKERRSLPGFPECKLYNLYYEIPDGIQEKGHPNPGRSFHGARRTAYLPSNEEGETVLKMLQRAFNQKLIFTVGDSRTTNMTDVVTWNDIHHKTNIMGGPSRYAYPDPEYLQRVTLELGAKGITPADVFHEKIEPEISN